MASGYSEPRPEAIQPKTFIWIYGYLGIHGGLQTNSWKQLYLDREFGQEKYLEGSFVLIKVWTYLYPSPSQLTVP